MFAVKSSSSIFRMLSCEQAEKKPSSALLKKFAGTSTPLHSDALLHKSGEDEGGREYLEVTELGLPLRCHSFEIW